MATEGQKKVVVAGKEGRTSKRTKCPITKDEFEAEAKPIAITVDGQTITGQVKVFKSGSFGFFVNDKVTLTVGGKQVKFQANCNVTAVGSKPQESD